jgi:hypothetical protein
MTALSLIFLLIFIFSAYAYGATTVLALRAVPVWGASDRDRAGGRLDGVLLVMSVICTVWFVMAALYELTQLGITRWRDAYGFTLFALTFAFPPLIMHTMVNESQAWLPEQSQRWRRAVWAMYPLTVITAGYLLAASFELVPQPQPLAAWIGMSVGVLFTICSVYSIALMRTQPPSAAIETPTERSQRRTMTFLFAVMIVMVGGLTFLRDQALLTAVLERITRLLPMFFLVTSIYFESRFEFYDLILKRAAVLLASLVSVGLYFTITLGALERLPTGLARPWLFAVALLPIAVLLPALHRALGRWLDRMWFGREFTPVEAVKQVLSAMQPATDEASLVLAAETRLSEMFDAQVQILFDDGPAPTGALVESVTSPKSGLPLRVAVSRKPGSRPLLSEDLSLLRSLIGVFGYMLENVTLQRRRHEQDQLAHQLRLQTSRSELKALRAQINPHFLFNALNAIASLIHTDPARADAAVEQLAEVFRYTLRRSEQEWAPLDQELAFAQAYLDVEEARFGRRLTYSIDSKSISGVQVPSMLLQTLVENAVKHGVSQTRGGGHIAIRAEGAGDALVLEVSDSGPGLNQPPGDRDGEKFGLRSVRDRLGGHFGERATFTLTRDDARGLTIARVDMPLVREPSVVLK